MSLYFLWSTFSFLGKAVSVRKVRKQSSTFGLDFLPLSASHQKIPVKKALTITFSTFSIPANLTIKKGALMHVLPLHPRFCFQDLLANGCQACLCAVCMCDKGVCYCSTDKTVEQMLSKSPGSLGGHRREALNGSLSAGSLLRKAHQPMLLGASQPSKHDCCHPLVPDTAFAQWNLLVPQMLTPCITWVKIWHHSTCVELSDHRAEK